MSGCSKIHMQSEGEVSKNMYESLLDYNYDKCLRNSLSNTSGCQEQKANSYKGYRRERENVIKSQKQ